MELMTARVVDWQAEFDDSFVGEFLKIFYLPKLHTLSHAHV
jgi:hypothetical protein